jgi:hypothetical protein
LRGSMKDWLFGFESYQPIKDWGVALVFQSLLS